MMPATVLRAALVATAVLVPATASSQVGNPLAQAVGMGGNYTALARGIGAPAWNPAGLGMPDNPGLSFTILPFGFVAGLGPVAVSDLAQYDGELIPREQRQEWLDAITAEGGEKGNFGTDVTFAALSLGRVALSATNSTRGRVNMAPDVAEVFFFGNAGLTGDPGDYTLAGSTFDVSATTTFAASLGAPVTLALGPLPDQHFALGATVKYTVGNFLVMGQESGSSLRSTPISVEVEFPVIHTALPDSTSGHGLSDLNNGGGFGVDVGAAWQAGIFSAGVVVKNLLNTFEWDPDALQFRHGTATWNADTSYSSFEELPIGEAPGELRERIDDLYTFSPVLSAGAAVRVLPFLTLTGDVRHALEDNLDVGVRNHVGVGGELTILPFLPVRAGVSLVSGGYQLAGGLGLKLGPVQLSAAAAARSTELGDDAVAALSLTFGVP